MRIGDRCVGRDSGPSGQIDAEPLRVRLTAHRRKGLVGDTAGNRHTSRRNRNGEGVALKSTDNAPATNYLGEPLRNGGEHGVTRRTSESVNHFGEPLDVHHDDAERASGGEGRYMSRG
jgi:hypothetical protein